MNEQIAQLKKELKESGEELERDFRFKVREIRKEVREDPDRSLAISILSGVFIGFVVGRLSK